MDTLEYVKKKYNITTDENTIYPIPLPMGMHQCLPKLFRELGFTKGAEVGVYRANFSKEILDQMPDVHLIGVDLWVVYPGYKDFSVTDIVDAERMSREIYAKYGARATLIKGESRDIAKTIPDGSLDFVFIDANHGFEWVVEDIAAWSKKVRKGGIVSGHDYNDYSERRKRFEIQVVPAVDAWTRAYQIKPWFVTTHNRNKCWFYVK